MSFDSGTAVVERGGGRGRRRRRSEMGEEGEEVGKRRQDSHTQTNSNAYISTSLYTDKRIQLDNMRRHRNTHTHTHLSPLTPPLTG